VEPWLASFGGYHWRCKYIADGHAALAGLRRLRATGKQPAKGAAFKWRLQRMGVLPEKWTALEQAPSKASGSSDTTGGDGRPGPVSSVPPTPAQQAAKRLLGSSADLQEPSAWVGDWPFPHCGACAQHEQKALDPFHWGQSAQEAWIAPLFPQHRMRLLGLVSDAHLILSQCARYGMLGPEWQAGTGVTWADWSNFARSSHPGVMSRRGIENDLKGTRQVRDAWQA
jgi:hypothetical protein